MAQTGPASQALQSVTAQERQHLRQILSWQKNPNVPAQLKAQVSHKRLFEAQWILDEGEFRAHRREPFPPQWLTAAGIQQPIVQLQNITNGRIPPWAPSKVLGFTAPTGLRLLANSTLHIRDWNPAFDEITNPNVPDSFDITGSRQQQHEYFGFIYKCADLALSLLATSTSRGALVQLILDIVTHWNRLGENHLYPWDHNNPQHDNEHLLYVTGAIQKIRSSFPCVIVAPSHLLEGSEAEARRRTWMRDPRMTWKNWDPQQGSRIKINETLIHAARDAARIAMDPSVTNSTRRIALTNWNNFMFMMTISMAHEYVHVIVGALTAGSSPKTPLRVHFDLDEIIAVDEDTLTPAEQAWMANPSLASIPAGLEVRVIGESGFSWESMVLGGKIVSCFLASMQIPNSARSSSSGAPHVV